MGASCSTRPAARAARLDDRRRADRRRELGIGVNDVVVAPADTDASGYDAGPREAARRTSSAGPPPSQRRTYASRCSRRPRNSSRRRRATWSSSRAGSSPGLAAEGRAARHGRAGRDLDTGPIQGKGVYLAPPIPFDAGCSVGNALATLNGCTCHVHLAEVEVDTETGRVEITRYVVAQDVGKAINPVQIEGQIHGGVLQGVGYALYEGQHLRDGIPLEQDLESYRLPTALDAPPIEYVLMEHPDPNGPFGAKGSPSRPSSRSPRSSRMPCRMPWASRSTRSRSLRSPFLQRYRKGSPQWQHASAWTSAGRSRI